MEPNHIIWTKASYQDFLKDLRQNADETYRLFNESLLASQLPTLGLRLPLLRKTAKEIARGDASAFLSVCGTDFHEERLLYGMVCAALPYADFLPHSDCMAEELTENWAICDTFASSLKKVLAKGTAKADYFRHIQAYLASSNPWAVRVGLIVMLSQYLEETYLPEVLRRTAAVQSEHYYVRMGQAWLLATAWAKFPEEVRAFLPTANLEPWTFRKFVQKARESYRVSPEDKAYLKSLLPPRK
ncbi:DNA alkylation repair protein [Anaerotignum lactatifermentans]|uniref:DNA alkylation repair protein n=1 Tax=Anaerotignum lactatifermentans TaxID=160404 RepID=A0ABS2G9G8_9FIRM|nr:DNA alkylation repair protein [Anaerotignum lactatifermentans]MBM6829562.1 DNA alkylation repair protein [Anaerotignum lactatifermentans]MBM6878056.1 DNA alkylation repair protein [Anaerotignum lactatifermentans]MBM6951114.1 DNA alkylation repair protein [Anaerotignum lactatifermentans]